MLTHAISKVCGETRLPARVLAGDGRGGYGVNNSPGEDGRDPARVMRFFRRQYSG